MVRFALALTLLFQTTMTFTVVGIDCSKCGPPVKKALEAVPGVKNVRVDTEKKTAWVDVPANFDREKLRAALEDAGFDATLAGEKRPETAPPASACRCRFRPAAPSSLRASTAKLASRAQSGESFQQGTTWARAIVRPF